MQFHNFSPSLPSGFWVPRFCSWLVFIVCTGRPSSRVRCEWNDNNRCGCAPAGRTTSAKPGNRDKPSRFKEQQGQISYLSPEPCCISTHGGEAAAGGCQRCHRFWKQCGSFFQLTLPLPPDPAIPCLGMYPREKGAGSHKNLHMTVYSRSIYNHPKLEKTQMSLNW